MATLMKQDADSDNDDKVALETTKRILPKGEPSEGGAVVIEDFEGNYDGWKLTGNAWREQPFDGKAYNQRTNQSSAKINGFQGNYIAFSYNRSNSDTGTATSDPFKIECDIIKFKIMGGATSATRVDLIVDGKAVLTASGDNTMTFRDGSWNVRSHKGKDAQIKIIDESAASSFGFVGVDDIRAEMGGGVRTETTLHSFEGINISKGLLNRFSDIISNMPTHSHPGSKFLSSESISVFNNLRTKLASIVYSSQYDHVPGRSPKALARILSDGVDNFIKENSREHPFLLSQDAKDYLLAFAISNWLRTRVFYDASLVGFGNYPAGTLERSKRFDANEVLNLTKPSTVCGGYSWLFLVLAYEAKITSAYKIEGTHLWEPNLRRSAAHSWNAIKLSDGSFYYIDATTGAAPISHINSTGENLNPQILPIRVEEVAYFLQGRYATDIIDINDNNNNRYAIRKNSTDSDYFSGMNFDTWRSVPINEYIRLQRKFDQGHFKMHVNTR
jgi:hypothetical protein